MSYGYGSPTKNCPRCNTLLPAQATVCSTCGLQFSAPSDPGYSATQYGGPGAPGGWPQSQPQPDYGAAYPPPPPPVYAPQPGYGGYPAAVAAPPKKRTGLIVAIVVVLVVVGGGAAAWFLYLNPARCSGPLFDRHGQPDSIPMPSGCSFNTMRSGDISGGVTANVWYWTVDSPNDPSALHSFYTQNLPSQGWTQKLDRDIGGGARELDYCGNNLVLIVEFGPQAHTSSNSPFGGVDITAPSGGSVLAIVTISDSRTIAQVCG